MKHFIARDGLLTLRQAAEVTGLPQRYLRHLVDTRRIPYEVPTIPGRVMRRIRRSVALGLVTTREARPT